MKPRRSWYKGPICVYVAHVYLKDISGDLIKYLGSIFFLKYEGIKFGWNLNTHTHVCFYFLIYKYKSLGNELGPRKDYHE